MKSSFHSIALIGLALSAVASPALAHHSAAAFDISVKDTLTGTVKTFEWSNPHTWITLVVPDGKGGSEDWKLEGGSVSILIRNGWTKDTIRPGDKVRLLISPRRDKAPGGEFFTVLDRNGQKVSVSNNASPQS